MKKYNAIIADELYRSAVEMKISDFKSYVTALGWECYESPREEALIVELLLSRYARDELLLKTPRLNVNEGDID